MRESLFGCATACPERFLFITKLNFPPFAYELSLLRGAPSNVARKMCCLVIRLGEPNIGEGASGDKPKFQFSFEEGGSLTERIS